MRTIRQNLEEAIDLLKTNFVKNHIQACNLVYMDLSSVQGFPKAPLAMLAYYQAYLIERHTSIKKVSFFEWAWMKIKSVVTKYKVKDFANRTEAIDFAEGGEYIKEISSLIRKAI